MWQPKVIKKEFHFSLLLLNVYLRDSIHNYLIAQIWHYLSSSIYTYGPHLSPGLKDTINDPWNLNVSGHYPKPLISGQVIDLQSVLRELAFLNTLQYLNSPLAQHPSMWCVIPSILLPNTKQNRILSLSLPQSTQYHWHPGGWPIPKRNSGHQEGHLGDSIFITHRSFIDALFFPCFWPAGLSYCYHSGYEF